MRLDVDLVVPTRGHPALAGLLDALADAGPAPARVLLVDARPRPDQPLLPTPPPAALAPLVEVIPAPRARRAAARNTGWRAASAPWVAFLDDDVAPAPDWTARLADDLLAAGPAAASAGALGPADDAAPRPGAGRTPPPTFADLACRRAALAAVGGLDERLVADDRVAVDLVLRLRGLGLGVAAGTRTALRSPSSDRAHRRRHRALDEALLGALHGPAWRARAGLRPTGGARGAATATAATAATAASVATAGRLVAATARAPRPAPRPAAVLFDRDGTIVVDVPYNGDPAAVTPVPGARVALERLRAAGIPTAVVSNQSGIARGLLDPADVDAVNRRVDDLLGPLGPWLVCPHAPDDGCACRKPAPGLVQQAAAALGVDPADCAVVGDIAADVGAATAVGARAVLVPTPVTRREEVVAAPEAAPDLPSAVELLLGGVR